MIEYDLIVVGVGSGGYEAILHAKKEGLKVAGIDLTEDTLGGNCLNRGCIPSKYMRFGANLLEHLSRASKYGISLKELLINFKALKEGRSNAVISIRESFRNYAKQIKADIYYARAKLLDKNTVLAGDEKIRGKYILISTGSSTAKVLNYSHREFSILNTDSVWGLEELPKRVIIVGGGASGTEFSYIFRMYGSEVYLIEAKDRLLKVKGIPEDSSRYLAKKLKALGVNIYTNTTIKELIKEDGKKFAILSSGEKIEYDYILETVGRVPNSDNLNIESLNIEKKGNFIKINDFAQTSVPNIYSCGDVAIHEKEDYPLMLAHKSMYEARIALNHIINKDESWKINYNVIPKIIYSGYEIASVGITEEEAEDMDIEIMVGITHFDKNPKAIIDDDNEGFVRMIIDKNSKEILGCHIAGPHAGELIHQVVHLMNRHATIDYLTKGMYSHPSLSESVVQAAMFAR